MAPSQLKRLKASLREQGIIGPQQSKKQKRKRAEDQKARNEKRLQRSAVLDGIREQFNPFQFKTNARGPKFEATSIRPLTDRTARGIYGRPGESKAAGEEKRRRTLLVEMQRRHKVGGIRDGRLFEEDETMTPEEKMRERFAHEQQSSHRRKKSAFDLENDGPSENLTHMGRALSFDRENEMVDDFDERDLPPDEESDSPQDGGKVLKRLRPEQPEGGEDGAEDDGELRQRKKSKQEVMKEIIAKSKLYKYERQAAKEADEDLRMEIDKELPNLQALLFRGMNIPDGPQQSSQHDDRPLSRVMGLERNQFEKDYDLRVKQLAQDRRAQPSERTKTEEEKAAEEANRLKELEERRVKRMLGEEESDSEDEGVPEVAEEQSSEHDFDALGNSTRSGGDENEFGLGRGIREHATTTHTLFDDEDDFDLDPDLVASASDIEPQGSDDEDYDGLSESEDDEFTRGLLTESEEKGGAFRDWDKDRVEDSATGTDGLPYTFPCPQSHAELLDIFRAIPLSKASTVVQRIRALYHPKLASENKKKMATFGRVLVQHLSYLGRSANVDAELYQALESLIRHVHSLAKTFPVEISQEFRAQLEDIGRLRPLSLNGGDLVSLTAIGKIFPTSDHFHQVVTPAALSIARYLGQMVPKDPSDYAVGAYASILAIDYQQRSQRYVPEVLNFCCNTLCSLAPVKPRQPLGSFPVHEPAASTRMRGAQKVPIRKLNVRDCQPNAELDETNSLSLRVAIANTTVGVLDAAADSWAGKPAFYETFLPALQVLRHMLSKPCRSDLPAALQRVIERTAAKLERMLKVARLSRRPCELHHHRPLAIKTFIPKFEDGDFDPRKHYDPDRERAELAKLRAEHKRERKGAMRELRKDASFMAREKLGQKKERDAAYEKKYKRLVAEIQGEEGREANAYEREKQARKRVKKR